MANYQRFKDEWSDRRIDYDRVYSYQCVDLVLQYAYEELHCAGIVRGNAIDYWTNPSAALLEKCDQLETTDVQVGDIVVLRSKGAAPGDFSGDGHIGICDHQDADNVYLLEQNALGTSDGLGRNAIGVYRAIPKSRMAGVLRPKPEAPPAPQPSYTYERFNAPMRVRVKPGCNLWNLNYAGGYANAQPIAQLSTDPNNPTEFTAVGKATKQDFADHPVYFMSTESFGSADATGVPAFNQGVNSVDLEPAPAAPPPPPPAPVVAETAAVVTPVAAAALDGDKIEVHVVPPNPEAWKASFKTNDSGDYIANASVIVHDLENIVDDMQLVKGQTVHVAGTFTGPDGIKYYRTVKSAATNSWRGIPIESLIEDDTVFTFKDDLIDDFREIKGYIGTRQKAIIAAAKIHGEVNWLANRLKVKGKK